MRVRGRERARERVLGVEGEREGQNKINDVSAERPSIVLEGRLYTDQRQDARNHENYGAQTTHIV